MKNAQLQTLRWLIDAALDGKLAKRVAGTEGLGKEG